jgi:hypothetical protein
MVSKVTYTDITNKQTNGESGAALVNDTKRAINEVIDLVGDIDLGGVGGSTLPVFQPRQLGDGVKTTFNTPATGSQGAKAQHFDVYLNYVYQRPELDFSIDGATGDLTFLDNAVPYAPNLNDTVDIKYVKPYTFDTSSDTPVEGTGTGVTKSIGDWFGEAGPAKVTATGTTTPRSLADWTSKETLTYNSVSAATSDNKLDIGQQVETVGYSNIFDKAGGRYVVVAGGTGTNDSGSYHDMSNGNQLKLIIGNDVNVKLWGATGDDIADDTTAIDNALAYYDSLDLINPDPLNGARAIMLSVNIPTLYFPAGSYNYNGAGYVPNNNKIFAIKGDNGSSSIINIMSDVHFCNPQDSSKVMAYVELSDIKFNGGRGAFFNEKTNLGNVAQGKTVRNCVFAGYTSVAFGSVQDSDARWNIERNWFDAGSGAATGTPVGLLLPDEVAETDIHGNEFAGNKYDIITTNDGISELNIGPNNSFFNTSGRVKEADIWFIPGDENQGKGVKVSYSRFSNENLDASKPNFLIADRAASDSHVFNHSTTKTTNKFTEFTISNNSIAGNGNPLDSDHVGYINSYSSHVTGLVWKDNRITQWRPTMIDFLGGITEAEIDDGRAGMGNLFVLNNQSIGNSYNPIAISNLKGAGMVRSEDFSLLGYPEQIATTMQNLGGLINTTFASNVRNSSKGVNVTKTDILDSQGGATAATFTFGADEVVVLKNTVGVSGEAGKVGWIEFEVKKSSATPLDAIQLEIVIQGRTSFYTLNLSDTWQNIRVPFLFSDDMTVEGDFVAQLTPSLFLDVGVKDSFDIGRKVIYQHSGPIGYNDVAI